jgi:hypothetical protein
MLHVQDPAAVAEDEKAMLAHSQQIHNTLEDMKKTFYSKEGMETTGLVRDALPAWEAGYHDWHDRIKARDLAGSMAQMIAVTNLGNTFQDASARAIEVKARLAEEKYGTNAGQRRDDGFGRNRYCIRIERCELRGVLITRFAHKTNSRRLPPENQPEPC